MYQQRKTHKSAYFLYGQYWTSSSEVFHWCVYTQENSSFTWHHWTFGIISVVCTVQRYCTWTHFVQPSTLHSARRQSQVHTYNGRFTKCAPLNHSANSNNSRLMVSAILPTNVKMYFPVIRDMVNKLLSIKYINWNWIIECLLLDKFDWKSDATMQSRKCGTNTVFQKAYMHNVFHIYSQPVK